EITQTVIILQIGNLTFTVNGSTQTLDSPPIIKNGRTLLPIRAVVEALCGTIYWDANEKKVTVTLGSTSLELWIGKPTAKVNGVDTPIDSTNSKVVPEIINGRTMLPLRFVAENLGCDVQWDGTTKTITITYPNRGG
ncbi:MAG: copper amine oxidase N-terminal domain-containing protein, partial [Caldisericum sp.]|uniref:copper amine oxidase N-terminal domain-containing protein n=1 Tax=Caldisericum sp. TaxID=2499687 RepID=UPI003D0F572B